MSQAIVIFGSSRRDGNTRKLADWIAEKLECEIVDLALLNISPYDYDHRNRNDDFLGLVDKILQFQNIIIASPVYWYSVSAQMKIFIDRFSDLLDIDELKHVGRMLKGRNVYSVCTSISSEVAPSFEDMLRNTFEYLGMSYKGNVHANCEDGYISSVYQNDVDQFIQSVRFGSGA